MVVIVDHMFFSELISKVYSFEENGEIVNDLEGDNLLLKREKEKPNEK